MTRARDMIEGPVITVHPNASITEAARVLNENEISGCPVVDSAGRLRGIISRTNILAHAVGIDGASLRPAMRLFVAEEDAEPDSETLEGEEIEEVPEVQDLMSEDVVTVDLDTEAAEIARLMSRERIHRVPVMEGGKVVGIITALDLLAHFPPRT